MSSKQDHQRCRHSTEGILTYYRPQQANDYNRATSSNHAHLWRRLCNTKTNALRRTSRRTFKILKSDFSCSACFPVSKTTPALFLYACNLKKLATPCAPLRWMGSRTSFICVMRYCATVHHRIESMRTSRGSLGVVSEVGRQYCRLHVVADVSRCDDAIPVA